MTRPLAAVTGGTGFVGRHLVEALSAAGWHVRMLVRRYPELRPGQAPVELILGSLNDTRALTELTRDADAIVHLAGAIKARRGAEFSSVNAAGTAAMVEAWRDNAPGARFVMLSSLAARAPEVSPYASSKAEGEAYVRSAQGAWCILRPGAIYGPGDRETLAVFKAARLPLHPVMNGPDARICLVHVADVKSALLQVMEPGAPTGTFEVSDARADGYSWRDIIGVACAAVGRSAHPVRIPPPILKGTGRIGDLLSAATGSSRMLTSGKVREFLQMDWSSSLQAQLPPECWQPKIRLTDGFEDAVAWYRAVGWLQ